MADVLGDPIQPQKLSDQVATRIRQLILDESLSPGDKLPGERDLAPRLGVSRIVIREAMQLLNAQGLIEIRHGSGTYVKTLSSAHVSDSISLFLKLQRSPNAFRDLMEVRYTLEVEIAALAAQRATDEDLVALDAALQGMHQNTDDPDRFTRYDLDFHLALAEASHNEIYRMLLVPISGLLLEFRLLAYSYDSAQSVSGGLEHHDKILERVRERDEAGARQTMRAHLQQAEQVFEQVEVQEGLFSNNNNNG